MWFEAVIPVVNHRDKRAALAQLDRVSGFEPEGRGFESLMPHHKIAASAAIFCIHTEQSQSVDKML